MSNIFQEISKKPSYVRTEVGGWVILSQGVLARTGWGWVGQKCDDFERTYFMNDPVHSMMTKII